MTYQSYLKDQETRVYILEKKDNAYEIGIGETKIHLGQDYMRQENGIVTLGNFLRVLDDARVPDELADRIKKCIIKE